MRAPGLGGRAKRGEDLSGEVTGGAGRVWDLLGRLQRGLQVWQEEVSKGAEGPVTPLELSLMALPRQPCSPCQNGHSLYHQPNWQLEGTSWGHM